MEWECAYPGEVRGSTNLCYTSVVLTTLVLKPEVLPRHWPSCQVLQVHANNGRLRHNLRGARRRRKSSGATRTKSSNPHHYSRSWERYNVSNNSRQLSGGRRDDREKILFEGCPSYASVIVECSKLGLDTCYSETTYQHPLSFDVCEILHWFPATTKIYLY